MTAVADIELPTAEVAEEAKNALRPLSEIVRSRSFRGVKLTVKRGGASVEVTVPRSAYILFLELLGHLAEGDAVTIVPIHAELTTQQAADLLNVSRPHLVRLLGTGAIPFRKVGTHRRLLAKDVFRYRAEQRERSEVALRELAAASQDLRLYDK
ncbi:MAG TPA: helix-turn-helix domain-containing protein [Gemmatimonadaceae bacterium]|nr:helix-turn-helix domain-containing protein [Gemmatimonadaceae bacterium]